jgi:hypothetical protein
MRYKTKAHPSWGRLYFPFFIVQHDGTLPARALWDRKNNPVKPTHVSYDARNLSVAKDYNTTKISIKKDFLI